MLGFRARRPPDMDKGVAQAALAGPRQTVAPAWLGTRGEGGDWNTTVSPNNAIAFGVNAGGKLVVAGAAESIEVLVTKGVGDPQGQPRRGH